MSRLHSFLQACIFTIFIIMAVSALCLGYVWRDGMLGPFQTQDALNDLFATLGPWAIMIDLCIFTPLLWWIGRSTFFKPKPPEIIKGLMLDKPLPPIPPPDATRPVFLAPPYDTTTDSSIWDEMKMK